LRESQHLAAVEVIEDALVLSVMRFADELIDEEQFEFPAAKEIRSQELQLAKALVNSLAADWDPSKYTDQYRDNLMRIVKGKVKGKEVSLESDTTPRQAEVVDLMKRLRRSLEQGSKGKSQAARTRAPQKAKRVSKRRSTRAA
jgi:DNA end-binding protein Ku